MLPSDWTAASGYAAGERIAADSAITAVFASNHEIVDREDAAAAVASRMTRWELLTDPAKHWHLIQTEAAFRWIVRSPALMAEQLDRTAQASRLPGLRVRRA